MSNPILEYWAHEIREFAGGGVATEPTAIRDRQGKQITQDGSEAISGNPGPPAKHRGAPQ